jgi:hypothetical protein
MLRAVALTVALATATGCMAQQGSGGKIKLSGPGPTIAGGAIVGALGGGLIYAVRSDDEDKYGADNLFTGIGIGMILVGVGAIAYGIYQLTSH